MSFWMLVRDTIEASMRLWTCFAKDQTSLGNLSLWDCLEVKLGFNILDITRSVMSSPLCAFSCRYYVNMFEQECALPSYLNDSCNFSASLFNRHIFTLPVSGARQLLESWDFPTKPSHNNWLLNWLLVKANSGCVMYKDVDYVMIAKLMLFRVVLSCAIRWLHLHLLCLVWLADPSFNGHYNRNVFHV